MSLPEKKIAVLFMNFGPYHIARLEALGDYAQRQGWQVHGIEVFGKSQTYAWRVESAPQYFRRWTLFPSDIGPHPSLVRMWRAISTTLGRIGPDVVVLAGYQEPSMLFGFAWAKMHRRPAIVMGESKADDYRREQWKELAKSFLVSRFDAALVGGNPQQDYFQSLGIPAEKIYLGYDVVDNAYFAQHALEARENADDLRVKLKLPERYFLSVSRFIPKKNLPRLIQAYQLYRQSVGPYPWELVLCGSGEQEGLLKNLVQHMSGVHFPGFQQIDTLPWYYGLADCFIMPSAHSEQWGLVVNEAMGSGLPVLVSKACGCAPDLVQEGVNGFTFDPYDVKGLARLMVKMSSGKVDLEAMGKASQKIIADWSPQVFAENLWRAIDVALEQR